MFYLKGLSYKVLPLAFQLVYFFAFRYLIQWSLFLYLLQGRYLTFYVQ